jgi:hypothetical protein
VSKGEISFEGVGFGYTPERTILNGATFNVPPGSKVAFVGTTGSGYPSPPCPLSQLSTTNLCVLRARVLPCAVVCVVSCA